MTSLYLLVLLNKVRCTQEYKTNFYYLFCYSILLQYF